jgi:hypothetical protein
VGLETFIPWTLVKRSVKKEIITRIDTPEAFTVEAAADQQRRKAEHHAPVVWALALAYYWQRLLDEGKFAWLTEIARAEGIDRAYVTRASCLAKLATTIVESVLGSSNQIRLDSLIRQSQVNCWADQLIKK